MRPTPASAVQRSTCSRKPSPECGSVSRPSVKAWITRSSTPELPAELDQRAQVLDARVHAAVGDEADQVHAPAGGNVAEGRAQHVVASQRAVARRPGRCASGPASRRRRRRGSCGRPRSCPSAPRAARPPGRRSSASSADSGSQSSSKTGVCASETALPGPSGASPQPSRTTSTARRCRRPSGAGRQRVRVRSASVISRRRRRSPRSASASRLAPPTSAPSTSGSDSSSPAFSGLTLPP